jgi:RNA polymerase sigma-70 factor (ECF subfamily)
VPLSLRAGFSLISAIPTDSEAKGMESQLQLETEWVKAPQVDSSEPDFALRPQHSDRSAHSNYSEDSHGTEGKSRPQSRTGGKEACCDGESDESVLRRLNDGEQGAMGELWERYAGLLFSQAFRVLQNPSEAEDIVAEVFSEVWRRAGGYHPERARPAAWLVTLVRRRAIDRYRERRSLERAEERMAMECSHGTACACATEDQVRITELRRLLEQALRRLPERQREAVCMVYFEGLTQREISKKTRTPIGTIKTRLELGLRKMRERIRGARPLPRMGLCAEEECLCDAAEAWAQTGGDNGQDPAT